MSGIDAGNGADLAAEEPTTDASTDASTEASAEPSTPALSTQPVQTDPVGLGLLGWLRWVWRTLTSMRTALVLLFLLALASIPGSIFPQRGSAPVKVTQYITDKPVLGRFMDKIGMFDVFASPWFAAIYILLFVSLAGCVLPRTMQHWRILRSRPPVAPRNLSRLDEYRVLNVDANSQAVLDDAAGILRRQRWRVDTSQFDGATGWVAAEKGYARETGNLVFHLALLGLLTAVGLGALLGFRGTVIVREGSSFADTRAQFDSFAPGRWFNDSSLPPFAFTLTDFVADYQRGGQQNGAAREFSAKVKLTSEPGSAPEARTIEVNDPLVVDGVKTFLVGHGYAPTITVRDTKGQVIFRDSVVFLPQDGNYTSTGVAKVPDTVPQLGLQGFFLPTAAVDAVLGPHSTFPAPDDPAVFISAWVGDLGLDSGRAQSVYKLDTSAMQRLGIEALRPGESWTLPGGHGTVTLDGYVEWASFTVARDPGKGFALASAIAAIAGLALSLLVRRRRVWVRVSLAGNGDTVVEVAGMTRSEHATVSDDVEELTTALVASARISSSTPAGA